MCRCGAVVTASGNAAPYRGAGQCARLMMPDRSFSGRTISPASTPPQLSERSGADGAPARCEARVGRPISNRRESWFRLRDPPERGARNSRNGLAPFCGDLGGSVPPGRESWLRQRWGVRWGVCRFENPAEIQRLTFAETSERGPRPNPMAELEFLEMRGLGSP